MLSKSALQKRLKKIRLIAMDVDGVLTDGSITLLKSGEELKTWNVKDRIAFGLLRKSGRPFYTAWITGRKSAEVGRRVKELKVDALIQHSRHKGKDLAKILKKFKVNPEESLFIGDDVVDLSAFALAGLSVCPRDGSVTALKACDWVTKAAGGRGVFREVVEAVLNAQGLFKGVVHQFDSLRN